MEKLKLPVIKRPLPPAPVLSMDQYLQFVELYVRYLRSNDEKDESRCGARIVNVPFRLK